MQHNIASLIEACNAAIHDAKAKAQKEYDTALVEFQGKSVVRERRRQYAAQQFENFAEQLKRGESLDTIQISWLDSIDGYYRDNSSDSNVKLSDLREVDEPVIQDRPGNVWMYSLKATLENLQKNNDSTTTVSTSFLKDAGFSSHIGWIARH